MKNCKYISEDERGGFKVAKVNLPLPDWRLRLFLEGKEDWLEEGLLVLAKKNKREGLKEKDLLWPKKEAHNKIMCHHLEEFRRRRVTTVMYQCKHGGSSAAMPPPFCGAQRSLCIAICTPSSTTTNVATIGGYAARNILQPSKPMQTKWVKEMRTSLMSFDTFT
jgi:hypothetical protein